MEQHCREVVGGGRKDRNEAGHDCLDSSGEEIASRKVACTHHN